MTFLLSFLIACWLWMQIVHELGHVLGAVLTNGTVQHVELHPLAISRTDVQGSTQPLVVIWAGPIVGCVLPLLGWWIVAAVKSSAAFLLRFFAGFCLLANGLYLAAGSFDGVGDCGDLLRHGAPIWSLWVFGLITVPPGLCLWHEQGRHFGFGAKGEVISPAISYGTIAITGTTIAAELCNSML
jgi:hypothetical protein